MTESGVNESYSSVLTVLYKTTYTPSAVITDFLAWVFRSSNRLTRSTFMRVWDDYFQGQFASHGKQIYMQHYDMVRNSVPKDKLLEYRVQEGWEPLCKFLDVPVPDCAFPNGNHKEETAGRIKKLVEHEMRKASWSILYVLGASFLCRFFLNLFVVN